jgi:hypothetical protein
VDQEQSDLCNEEIARPPTIIYLSLFFLLVCLHSLGAKYFVFSYPIVPGVSSFYLIVAFMIVCALWFGMWGVFAAYFGCVIGAGILSGLPLDVSLYWSVADLLQAFIPLIAFRYFHADPVLQTWHDLMVFMIFGVILNNLAGAIWGAFTLEIGGIISSAQLFNTMGSWFIVNIIVSGCIAPFLLYFVTPWMKTQDLYQGVKPLPSCYLKKHTFNKIRS